MEDMELVNEIIAMILGDRRDLQVQVVYTDDLYREARRRCQNPSYLEQLNGLPQSVKNSMRSWSGTCLPPKALGEPYTVLVSNFQREDGFSHYCTIAQEALHAKNHALFCETHGKGDVNALDSHPWSRAFRIWDEFDARRTSHRLYLSLILQQMAGYSPADVSNLLREQELSNRLQEINSLLQEKNSVELYRNVAAILGMFQVWELYYDLPVVPHMNNWCFKLYEALTKYGSLQQVDFDALETTIQELWLMRQ